MRPVATLPLLTSPELRPLAERVFRALACARFVTVAGLLAHLGPEGLTSPMLQTWVRAELILAHRVVLDALEGNETEYLALSLRGARALAHATGERVRGMSPSRMLRSTQTRAHDVLVGEVALSVMALAARGAIDLQGLERDDERIATSVVVVSPGEAPKRIALQADGYVLVGTERGPSGILIEVDRGTISTARMAEKYRGYLAWSRQGGPLRDFTVKALRVLTIAQDERRLAKLHDAALNVNDSRRSGFLLFALAKDFRPAEPERLLEPIARTLGAVDAARVPIFDSFARPDPQTTAPASGSPPGRHEVMPPPSGVLGAKTNRSLAVAGSPSPPML